jgi:hypothetical protein
MPQERMENVVTYSMPKQSCNISRKLKNVALLGFYALRRNWPRVPEMVWDALATGHKMKIETQIEEPSTPMDYWDMILAREPLTPRAMPQKFLYSLILRTSVFLSLKQCNIWIKGSNL